MSILKNFEFNKVNPQVEEELKHLQIKNKIRYMIFWGSIITATALTYNYVAGNLNSVSQKASLNSGTAPLFAFFETNWEKKAVQVKEDLQNDEKIFNEKSNLVHQIEGNSVAQPTLSMFVKDLNDDDIASIIKNNDDYKNILLFEKKLKLINSKTEFTINENSYKVVDIVNKLIVLDEATRTVAVDEPVTKIFEANILEGSSKPEIKEILLSYLSDKDLKDYFAPKYKTAEDILKASIAQVKKGDFEVAFGFYLNSGAGLRLFLVATKQELEKKLQASLIEQTKKIEDSKSKLDSLKKEVEALKTKQQKRVEFITKVNTTNTGNYFENKESLKTLLNEIEG